MRLDPERRIGRQLESYRQPTGQPGCSMMLGQGWSPVHVRSVAQSRASWPVVGEANSVTARAGRTTCAFLGSTNERRAVPTFAPCHSLIVALSSVGFVGAHPWNSSPISWQSLFGSSVLAPSRRRETRSPSPYVRQVGAARGALLPLDPSALRFCCVTALVMDPEQSGREPPLDGPAKCGPPTPAVRIAAARAIARIVDSVKHSTTHPLNIRPWST
jgi:hypothetical protein